MGGYLTHLFEIGGVPRASALGSNLLAWTFMGVMTLAVCVLAFLFGATLMPETKGRTLEEIGDSWSRRTDRRP